MPRVLDRSSSAARPTRERGMAMAEGARRGVSRVKAGRHPGLQGGAERLARVRIYDFRRATRFSKEHIRIISRVHDYFARLWGTHLSAELRTPVQLRVESTEEIRYEEFIEFVGSAPPVTLVQVFRMLPGDGELLAEMNLNLVFAIIDRLMGGPGTGPYRERELTNIEVTLFRRVLDEMAEDMGTAWRTVASHVEFRTGALEHNPQFLRSVMPNETVLVVTLAARIGVLEGLINFCLPYVTLDPFLPELAQHRFGATNQPDPEVGRERVLPQLRHVPVTVSAELGRTDLSLSDVMALDVGDVIRLNQPIAAPIVVKVDGVPAFSGSIGVSHRHYAVKIVDEWSGGTDGDG